MANPRQRLKARSGTHSGSSANSKRRQRQRLAKAPVIKGPDVLREKWDPKKTVKQNYAALGLVADLKMRPSGGEEAGSSETIAGPSAAIKQTSSSIAGPPAKGLGRIIRDADGNVIDIIEGGDGVETEQTPWGESLKNWEDSKREAEDAEADAPTSSETVQALESLPHPAPLPRHVSELEAVWLLSLVRKHGEDVEAMHMDKRLNESQKTKGEIRNRIKRAGGFAALHAAIAHARA